LSKVQSALSLYWPNGPPISL